MRTLGIQYKQKPLVITLEEQEKNSDRWAPHQFRCDELGRRYGGLLLLRT
jgi:hypothetical protein